MRLDACLDGTRSWTGQAAPRVTGSSGEAAGCLVGEPGGKSDAVAGDVHRDIRASDGQASLFE